MRLRRRAVRGSTPGPPVPASPRPRLRALWLLAFAAFFLVAAGWALALPDNGTNDEDHHILRAYAVASGQVWSPPAAVVRGGGASFDIPRSLLVGDPSCTREDLPASCQLQPPDDRTRVPTPTAAGRYNPLYYLPVGLPMLVSPDHTGTVAGRLVSAAMCAALLASAVVVAARRRDTLLMAAVIVVATPNVLNLAGSINPNGPELAAGILLWTTLLALLRARDGDFDDATTHRLLLLAAAAAALLLTLRTLGPMLLGLTVLFGLALAGRGRVGALVRRRDTRWLLGGLSVVSVYAVVWTLVSGMLANPPQPHAQHWPLSQDLAWIFTDRLSRWVIQVVGRFSYGEVFVPNAFFVGWYALAFVLVVPALLFAVRRQALVVLGVLVTSVAVLVGFELAYVDHLGWSQQSRYVMPFGVGFVLAAVVVGERFGQVLGDRRAFWSARLVAVVAGVLHVWALALVMSRFQVGVDAGLRPFDGGWLPPTGPVLPLLATAAGAAGLVVLAWRFNRPERPARVSGSASAAPPSAGRTPRAGGGHVLADQQAPVPLVSTPAAGRVPG
ncbi:MAG TPA: DUF2142 domain-containing protein, partial [Cryptosporangiaceae bacterium]|nr:DUF2142 domain-containing protein [Cryptosporangiaceae bacterium]